MDKSACPKCNWQHKKNKQNKTKQKTKNKTKKQNKTKQKIKILELNAFDFNILVHKYLKIINKIYL